MITIEKILRYFRVLGWGVMAFLFGVTWLTFLIIGLVLSL